MEVFFIRKNYKTSKTLCIKESGTVIKEELDAIGTKVISRKCFRGMKYFASTILNHSKLKYDKD